MYWHHDFPDEPVAIYSEIGPDGYECRRVEEYPGAHVAWADGERAVGGCALGREAFGDIADVAAQPEFTAFEILGEEFEGAWRRATATGDGFRPCR